MSDTRIESIRTEITTLEAQLKAKKAELRALKPAKASAEPKPCGCGCGELTRGGDFLPGHDARLRGQLLKAIDAGEESALAALLARPSLLHGATENDLRARLGSATRKKEAQVARVAEREVARAEKQAQRKPIKPVPKPNAKARIDKDEM